MIRKLLAFGLTGVSTLVMSSPVQASDCYTSYNLGSYGPYELLVEGIHLEMGSKWVALINENTYTYTVRWLTEDSLISGTNTKLLLDEGQNPPTFYGLEVTICRAD